MKTVIDKNTGEVKYCFFGETGINRKNEGLKSLMGFVIHKSNSINDPGEVNIVFRGSRSGAASRNLNPLGGTWNPDWKTDLDLTRKMLIPDDEINKSSNVLVAVGFSRTIKSISGSLKKVLIKINERNDDFPPTKITVTGHSLGGALAVHFASSILHGSKRYLGDWPWSDLKVITYGAPASGNTELGFSLLESGVSITRIYVSGDSISTQTNMMSKSHFGTEIKLQHLFTGGTADQNVTPHNLQLIKWSLVNRILDLLYPLTGVKYS